ncbi:DUF5819 family protein [Streptomyces sp. NPDC051217]|uniref:DUF5819 family protein n=1 Tax=Streptomyces sp. NPDC051217 TaxID=3365644 RepID=UPI0037B52925
MDSNDGKGGNPESPPGPPAAPPPGIAGLSFPYRVAAAVALAVVALVAVGHVAMVFLHVAPQNTVSKEYGEQVGDWVYPEFEQNWKLFAPNPLQQNIAVEVRADVNRADGSRGTTGWINLTAEDAAAIRGNPFPSHVDQNELRRGWDFYVNSHDDEARPNGLRGQLSESYIRRIVMLRLESYDLGGPVERIQLRSVSRVVQAPPWSDEKNNTKPGYRVFPWWTVTPDDLSEGVRNDGPPGDGPRDGGRTEARG